MAGSNLDLIAGRQVVTPLTNKSGVQVVEGDIVILDIANDASFKLTTTEGDLLVIGVVQETIENNALGRICMAGRVEILTVDGSTSRGDYLKTSSTTKKATPVVGFEEGCFAQAMSAGATSVIARVFVSVGLPTLRQFFVVLTAEGGTPQASNGCQDPVQVEFGTNKTNIWVAWFDPTSDEYMWWAVPMPDWNGGIIYGRIHWFADAATTGSSRWGVQLRSLGDNEDYDQALGTVQIVEDAWQANDRHHITGETPAITAAGTPAAGEELLIRLKRDAVTDTLDADGGFRKLVLRFTESQTI